VKSVVYTENGDSSVLRLVERPVPEPGPGQVRVRIVVSGVNPTDWMRRQGLTGSANGAEITPHQDGSGVVDAVGPEVTGVRPGDRVWVFLAEHLTTGGTAGEYSILPEWSVVPLPDAASFESGAAMGVPAITAHRALTVAENGPSRLAPGALDGTTVLVSGGAGAVGHAAIQLARWAGATVITTVSGPEKGELARAAGAHHVVNYREGDPAAEIKALAPGGVDLVVEVSIATNMPLNLSVIRPGATISSYATNGGATVELPIRASMTANVRLQFILLYTLGERAWTAATEDLTAALRDGALPVGEEHGLPLHRFGLEETAAAQDAVRSGAVGKVILDVSAP
jgi:NADPH:quinone reductase